MLALKRPGIGIPPTQLSKIIGRHARMDIKHDVVIQMDWLK
jgi:sialic acid synthase SpsE